MPPRLSPLASIAHEAEIETDVAIGPYCVVGPRVRISRGCRLENHVTITGNVTLGCFNHVFPGAVIGGGPTQFCDQATNGHIIIGEHNIIREKVTIGSGERPTVVGDHNLLMACCHLGGGCQLGNHITIANGCVLGKQVVVGDFAIFSGRVAISADVEVGCYSFASISSRIICNVPPFVIVEGNPARPRMLNRIGLLRNGFSANSIRALNIAYRLCFRRKMGTDQAREVLGAAVLVEPRLAPFIRFIEHK